MFGGRSSWIRYSKRFLNFHHHRKSFCTNSNNKQLQNLHSNSHGNNNGKGVSDIRDLEAYRDLDKLDFMKAAKILFSNPPKQKKFGLDFHLVQLFFALMPSLAVYLVAQYARHEIKRMEAELEQKKKAEEEQKAKQMEAAAAEEKEAEPDSEIVKVKERLEALEEAIKEIVVESKKPPLDETIKSADHTQEKVDPKNESEDKNVPTKNQTANQDAASSSGKTSEAAKK